MVSVVDDAPTRTHTPVAGADNNPGPVSMPEASTFTTSTDAEEDSRRAVFAELYRKTEARVALLFSDDGGYDFDSIRALMQPPRPSANRLDHPHLPPPTTDHAPIHEPPLKKAKRVIDEDDYGDDDDEDEAGNDGADSKNGTGNGSGPTSGNGSGPPQQLLSPSKTGSSPVHSVGSPDKQFGVKHALLRDEALALNATSSSLSRTQSQSQQQSHQKQSQVKSSEDVRKELEEARNATEEAARRSFFTIFHTLENDRTAMLEQQQLEESEKQIQAEMEKNGSNGPNGAAGPNQGTLSSANLGASSLTLKHLIARIDSKRDQVKATDAELRSLINEVRKNRSKWASEENVGQEELYEALDKVLSELKAHTEYSTPFLQRVNKREAPDYHLYVKQPMDLGTMTKKLKGLQFKSKAEFVADLNLVWDNCLKYNRDAGHPLRRMATGMRKEAEKLIPLIPDLVIRSRAEVEAEERRKQNGGDDDGGDDSDDEPIMSSRGRKTGAKGVANKSRAGGTTTMMSSSTGAGGDQKESTPSVDQKPVLQLNGLLAKTGREGSDFGGADTGSNGFSTPVGAAAGGTGSLTPSGLNGHLGNVDAMDIDASSSVHGNNGMAALNRALNEAAEQTYEDEAYKIWKQVTKKDRALIAKQRYELFLGNKLNVDEPALLRNKAGMRWYLKGAKQAEALGILGPASHHQTEDTGKEAHVASSSKAAETTLAEMEDDVEKVVPDYYEPESIVPDIPLRLQWVVDDEGQVVNQNEEFLRLVPAGHFVSPTSKLTKRMESNMRQIQETRKICSKIGVVKQMQIQTQRYDPEPFHEADIEPQFISGDGPFIAGEASRAAMQRAVSKIFFHAGFEELQPSAMDAMTDIAADYFTKLCHTFNVYNEAEKKEAVGVWAERGNRFQPRYSPEEVVLHTLYENGHDIDSLDSYAREEVERLGTKLSGIHDRMKMHLSDLLRPALQDGGTEAFQDGSDQFVGGDFAEELGEDFFGFKALGLDREFGLDIMSVPLHLLQSRVRNQHTVDAPTGVSSELLFEDLKPLDAVTTTGITEEIGLVKNFFLAKLHANNDQALVEDEDLPVKQRRPRPRLGATGKIVSPQKRPPKEQIAMAKRKKREQAAAAAAKAAAEEAPGGAGGQSQAAAGATAASEKGTPVKKLKTGQTTSVPVPNLNYGASKTGSGALGSNLTNGVVGDGENAGSQGSPGADEKDDAGGLMSPESIH
ncbi:transcriptional activator SPT7 [Sporothrix brasiliensis 5110]|uniref:Transcriptional activator SPT7 n=1 Tax=Sporothrix brasiliensis 5110 TaxID=1398154 RepID=A0A0C2FD75_9PEZI|nr:transcriptional activator SPT7 [Sporothrix brasiliensis 5110]KIH89083.1 transcriptional activator SPT7 [Sporothrix brasiliensis 5110]